MESRHFFQNSTLEIINDRERDSLLIELKFIADTMVLRREELDELKGVDDARGQWVSRKIFYCRKPSTRV